MSQLKLISEEAKATQISHPQLQCPYSHSIVNICVNKNCNLKALYCQQQECNQFQPHEDCEHITLKSLTRSLQKCSSIKMTLRREISSIYDTLYKSLKEHILNHQKEQLPIGDLDEVQEQIINQIYFKRNAIEMDSVSARKLSQKIKTNKLKMEEKLPQLIELLKSEMQEMRDKIMERGSSTWKELSCSLVDRLGVRPIKLKFKQRELLKEMDQTNLQSMLYDRKQSLQAVNYMTSKQIQINRSHTVQLYEDMKKNYEVEISNLKQQIQAQQAILQGLIQQNNSTNDGQVIMIKEEEDPKEQLSDQDSEKQFSIQPSNFQHILKVQDLYARILSLQKKGIIDYEVLGIYEMIADELRSNKFLRQSNYFYQKAREACAKFNRKGSKEEAYQIFWIASNYNQLQKYQKALPLFNLCLTMYEKVKGKNKEEDVASTLNNIAIVYYNLQNYELAIEYNRKAIDLQKKMKKSDSLNIIIYTKNIALAYFELEQYQDAQKSLKECLNKIHLSGQEAIQEECICYNKLAEVYILVDKIDLCLEYVVKYLQKMKESKSQQCVLKGQYLDWLIGNMSEEWSYEMRECAEKIMEAYIQVIEGLRLQLYGEQYE